MDRNRTKVRPQGGARTPRRGEDPKEGQVLFEVPGGRRMTPVDFRNPDGSYDFVTYCEFLEQQRRQKSYNEIAHLAEHLFPNSSEDRGKEIYFPRGDGDEIDNSAI